MSETPPITPDVRQQIRDLMGRATLSRVRGNAAEALQLAQQALVLHEPNAEVHEFIGDALMELKRGADALGSYRRARELNPHRVELEDKLGRAAIQRAARDDAFAYSTALLEGRVKPEPKRNPGYAAIFSIAMPGLGQLYNGQFGKGLIIVAAFLLLATLSAYSMLNQSATSGMGMFGPTSPSLLTILGGSAVWVIPLALIYIYAVVDAVVYAGKSGSPDKTGLV